MEFSRKDIVQALCNEYKCLFKDAYDPGVDLSFEEYQSEMEAKTLEELIKETSTDNEFYTIDDFMKRYGWSKYGIVLACIPSSRPFAISTDRCLHDGSFAVALFCKMSGSSLDPEDSTDAGTSLQSR